MTSEWGSRARACMHEEGRWFLKRETTTTWIAATARGSSWQRICGGTDETNETKQFKRNERWEEGGLQGELQEGTAERT